MLAHTTWLIAKTDPLKYIFEKLTLTGRIARWQMALLKYGIVYTNQKAIKGSVLSEQLAQHPLNEYHPLRYEFPDEKIMTMKEINGEVESDDCKLCFGGALNLLRNGIGVVLAYLEGQYFPFPARLGFECTNNMAEYEACAMGITMAMEHQVKKLKVFRDLVLVIYQLRGEWETCDAKLIPYHDHIMAMGEKFDEILFHYVSRDENQMVDALATLSSMLQENEKAEADGKPWYHDIREYLKKGIYPLGATKNDKRTLRRLAAGFFLSRVILYKRSMNSSYIVWMTGSPGDHGGDSSSRLLLVQDGVGLLLACEEVHQMLNVCRQYSCGAIRPLQPNFFVALPSIYI
ncbi:hypothetical protein CR513_42233, partial [Mucuna pruriens]